jgi:putative copper resistance protein D
MIEAGLVWSRLVHYLAILVAFGASLFPFYAYGSRHQQQQALVSRLYSVSAISAAVAIVSGASWLLFAITTMAGTLDGAFDTATFFSVIHDTDFGRLWLWRLVIAALLLILCAGWRLGRSQRVLSLAILLGSAMLLASIAGTGHTQTYEGSRRILHSVSDGVHLLAAGAWIGGLVALALLIKPAAHTDPIEAHRILARFSGIGTAAVGALVATGLINGWFLVGSIANLTGTSYGKLLCVKLTAFLAMIVLAGLNRYWLVPALAARAIDRSTTLARLRYHIYAEQALAFAVLLAVSFLGTMVPANS